MSESKPKIVHFTVSDKLALQKRLQENRLTEQDRQLLSEVVENQHWLVDLLEKGKLTIHKLKGMLFGSTSEKHKPEAKSTDEKEEPEPEEAAANQKRKGHGRIGADAYKNKEVVHVLHPVLRPGDPCPDAPCPGTLYAIGPGSFLHIAGHGLAKVTEYHIEKLRCSACGLIIKAPFTLTEKYDFAFKAQLALQKFFLGIPYHRQESYQEMQGIPLPESTQWELLESLAGGVIPVVKYLEYLAAQGDLIQNDDTTVRILSLMGKNRNAERPGMYTTGLIGRHGDLKIRLFYSGRKHSGENLTQVLRLRHAGLPPIKQMCDALSMNRCEQPVILCHCLAHARRKFIEIEHAFQSECAPVIKLIGQVYHYEAMALEQQLNPAERLAWHQEHSQKVMDELHRYLAHLRVEPNSAMGGAIKYTLKHWTELTQFLKVDGVPLDNNATERALKAPIRSRKNSLFYKTEYSAQISAYLMSIIYTCHENEINPLSYLIRLQENKAAVLRNPEQWLPWSNIPMQKAA